LLFIIDGVTKNLKRFLLSERNEYHSHGLNTWMSQSQWWQFIQHGPFSFFCHVLRDSGFENVRWIEYVYCYFRILPMWQTVCNDLSLRRKKRHEYLIQSSPSQFTGLCDDVKAAFSHRQILKFRWVSSFP
jgi:hypothetical protein